MTIWLAVAFMLGAIVSAWASRAWGPCPNAALGWLYVALAIGLIGALITSTLVST